MISIISQVNESAVTDALKKLIDELSIKNKIMQNLAEGKYNLIRIKLNQIVAKLIRFLEPKLYLIVLASFMSLFLLSCILEIYGSFQVSLNTKR